MSSANFFFAIAFIVKKIQMCWQSLRDSKNVESTFLKCLNLNLNHGSAVASARVLCAENPDLVQLKSLLAGLTLPVKSSSAEVDADERDGKRRSIFDSVVSVYLDVQ